MLALKGGGLNALGRETVGALLNSKVFAPWDLTTASVISQFNAVYPGGDYETLKNTFENLTDVNGRVCPLN